MIENATPDDFVVVTLSNSRKVVGVLVYEGIDGLVLEHPHFVRIEDKEGKSIMQLFEYNELSDDTETKFLPQHVVSVNMLSEAYIKYYVEAVSGTIKPEPVEKDVEPEGNGTLH